jgi:lipopolysaccharide/colanic/teichoic acid biosynthesis glycosyltransferase
MHRYILIVTDIIVLIAAFVCALWLRFNGLLSSVNHAWSTFAFVLCTMLAVFYYYDLYNHLVYTQRLRIFFKTVKAWLFSLVAYVVVGFLTSFAFLIESRIFIILLYVVLFLFLFVIRLILMRKVLEYYFGDTRRRTVCRFVGTHAMYTRCRVFFENNRTAGLVVEENAAHSESVFLWSQATKYERLYSEIKQFLVPGTPLHIASPLFTELRLDWECCDIDGVPVYTFQQKKHQAVRDVVRRIVDIFGSLFCMIVLAPLFAIVSLVIVLSSPGPAIYKQKRCGKNGKEFTLYKFRSMYACNGTHAEQEIATYNYFEARTPKAQALNSGDITDIGRVLRKTSIDEWPQFLNVLIGDMSIIGPRPPLPHEVEHYKKWHRDRLSVKQGMTGLWQIYGRGEMPCDKSIFLDLIYVMNRSLTLDVKLLFQTIPAVILGKGAY